MNNLLKCLLVFCLFLVPKISFSKTFIKLENQKALKSFLIKYPNSKLIHKSLLWVLVKEPLAEFQLTNVSRIEKEKNYRISNAKTPLNPKLWGMEREKVSEVWNRGLTGEGIVVAVVDTGVNYEHLGLSKNIWVNALEKNGKPGVDDDGNGFTDDVYGWDFYNYDNNPADDHSHGSHVAGTVAGYDKSINFYGVAKNAKIMSIKSHNKSGNGTEEAVVRSILYAADNGADVINCSWGGAPEAGERSELLLDAINYANEKGAVVVAAAGNESSDNDVTASYPANYQTDNLISVASIFKNGKLSYFSNYGANTVHIAAPGSNIYSVRYTGGYTHMSGTSMAAPFISGAAALIAEKLSREGLAKRPLDIREVMINEGKHTPELGNTTIGGEINLDGL